ncbi:isocitrate lyase/PEP mutase family protein [Kitasatospora paracochleata]|uniref:2-methylisocitrate lyase-like PEP mutase family enzyme n=1 Tax=Kitasatospora paracochleata TaxID=58354 RepID=A0ABT1IPB5_9ACTN|nr:isocitrate lyase/phosphoenolpyruvate mutase family protein [Kitasatospora paracochleata]MCP2306962.1 2-methylisocitrate lyase-like PEP mutase family enzyme [Kitasatospora paracochleata]
MTTQQSKADLLHSLHRAGDPLVLANVWDGASARLVAGAGAKAIATASASVSWTLGSKDGGHLDRERALAQAALVVRMVDLPVTADLESGYADTPAGVGGTIAELLATGAVGVNLEDSQAGGLRPLADAAERIAAARAAADAAGVRLFVNARTDVFLHGPGGAEERLEQTLTRARAFVEAGASGVFVPGVADPELIAVLAKEIPAPLNVGGTASVAELAALGVARISLGPGLAMSAYAVVKRAAEEAYATGTFGALAGGLTYPELNGLF